MSYLILNKTYETEAYCSTNYVVIKQPEDDRKEDALVLLSPSQARKLADALLTLASELEDDLLLEEREDK